jgi:uncharacterized protein
MHVENVEITAHDADRVFYKGPQIDLGVGIREAIILSQPIMSLCKDDCSGICPVCGVNLNKKRCACKVEKVGPFTLVPEKPKGTARKKHNKTRKE